MSPQSFHNSQQQIRLGLVAPARLHLGFLDMGGHLGRRFGSVGVSLSHPSLRIEGQLSEKTQITGPQSERVETLLGLLSQHFHFNKAVELEIKEAIPSHSGLGSGTQLALAVGTLVSHLHGTPVSVRDLAGALDRGNRSGIGIGAFESGGFILDGGRGTQDHPPPVVARIQFPEAWRLLLLFDPSHQGLHGSAEIEAFRNLPVFPESMAARLCHITLMRALPALAEADLEPFGNAITELQETVGDHFSPAQGGRFTSHTVTAALDHLGSIGARCRGQSSWGPTGFVIAPDEKTAQGWLQSLSALQIGGLATLMTEANHQGALWYTPQPSNSSLMQSKIDRADITSF